MPASVIRNRDEERQRLAGGSDWVGCVSFSPYADLLITAAGKMLRAWNGDGQLLRAIQPHTSTITDLAWHPSSRYWHRRLSARCTSGIGAHWNRPRNESCRIRLRY